MLYNTRILDVWKEEKTIAFPQIIPQYGILNKISSLYVQEQTTWC